MAQTTVAQTGESTLVANARAFFESLVPPPREFDIRLWEGTHILADVPSRFGLRINSPGALRRMFRLPLEYSLAEAYIRGDFDVNGQLIDVFDTVDRLLDPQRMLRRLPRLARLWLSLPNDATERQIERGPAQLAGERHSKARDKAALQYHYDVGNDFYALWLGRDMVYSCAYFKTGAEDIDTAQQQKLDLICRKLRLRPGERVLDIGCGWGGLAIFAAQHYGASVFGVTLSQRQHEFANRRIRELGLSDQVEVRLMDYRDLGDESFDKLVSIGMFEHVGKSHLPEYFAHAHRLLKPGGAFLNHGIAAYRMVHGQRPSFRRRLDAWLSGAGKFGQRYIFPDGELVPVNVVNEIAQAAGFEVRDLENLREHYALTLRRWIAGLEARREEAIRASNETIYRTWRLYMSASVHGFESAQINVNQTLLVKLFDGRQSSLPLTREDWYDG